MWIKPSILAVVFSIAAQTAFAQEPLSAIDWLDQSTISTVTPVHPTVPRGTRRHHPKLNEPAVSSTIDRHQVVVTPLGAVSLDFAGLLPPSVTGFPSSIWQFSDTNTLIALFDIVNVNHSPVLQEILLKLLLAENTPPTFDGSTGRFLKARLAKLQTMGAVEQAYELVTHAGRENKVLFPAFFDLALLSGRESTACEVLQINPSLTHDYATRIFCLARSGEWLASSLLLETAATLEGIEPEMYEKLLLFLDPELADGAQVPEFSERPSPLEAQIAVALGEPLNTTSLPSAFSWRTLDGSTGWKNQLESAERLAGLGVLPARRWLAMASTRKPAASGGIWDRVAAVQSIENAIKSNPGDLEPRLTKYWSILVNEKLLVPLANVLVQKDQNIDANPFTARFALLSPHHETFAQSWAPTSSFEKYLKSISLGSPDQSFAVTPQELAIATGFTTPAPPTFTKMLADKKLGEVILRAMVLWQQGLEGDLSAMSEAISIFLSVGMEDVARRGALQFLILAETQIQ